jgi:hypothetical protein
VCSEYYGNQILNILDSYSASRNVFPLLYCTEASNGMLLRNSVDLLILNLTVTCLNLAKLSTFINSFNLVFLKQKNAIAALTIIM